MHRLLSLLAASALSVPAATAQPAAPGNAPVAAPAFDRAVAATAITELAETLERDFVDPAAAKAYATMLRANLKAGRYAGLTDARALAERVTADLQAVHRDGHLSLRAPGGPGPRRGPGPAGAPARPAPLEQAGWIAPGIAYVRINGFPGDPKVAAELADFLDTHGDAKALILDARTHGGGGLLEMDALLSRLYAEPATVMVLDTRASVAARQGKLPYASLHPVAAPADLARAEHRVVPHRPTSGLTKAHVYYLTAGRTGSAGEHLASVLKYSKRGTLIGDTTGGAGHYGGMLTLSGGYTAFVPFGHSYYPGTTGWEQTGVEPDIKVVPERALIEALIREGVAPAEAERLAALYKPTGSMARLR